MFFNQVKEPRDRTIFMLMLRCGLRVEEVAHPTLGAIDAKREVKESGILLLLSC